MSGVSSWSKDLFQAGLEYVGTPLFLLGAVNVCVGIAYLVWAEISETNK